MVTLHLLAVSVASFGPVLCLWLEWRWRRRDDESAGRLGRRLARLTLWSGAAAVVLGATALALLWFDNQRPYFQGFAVIPSRRLWFGLAELLVYFVALAAYLHWWGRMRTWPHAAIGVFAATDIIYHFPPLFSAVVVLSTRPASWGQPLDYAELLAVLTGPETLSRVAHLLTAGLAVTALAITLLAARDGAASNASDDDGGARPHGPSLTVRAGRLALLATVAELPLGLAVLFAAPAAARGALLLGDTTATLLFGAAMLVMLALLHHLAAIALGDAQRSVVNRSAGLMVLMVLLMVAAGHRARRLEYASIMSSQPTTHTSHGEENP